MKKNKALILLGPTATGKTAFGVRLAHAINGEIISVDSRQVYRGLDIGSGKDLNEYTMPDGTAIRHHLIDIVEPDQEYSLATFMRDARLALNGIISRNNVPIFVGGTALYLHALLNSYELRGGDPDREKREELNHLSTEALQSMLRTLEPDSKILERESANRSRMIRRIEILHSVSRLEKADPNAFFDPPEFLILGVYRKRSEIHTKIEQRLDTRLKDEMLKEAIRLHENGLSWERLEFFGLEYRQMALHLQGKTTYEEMRNTLLVKIRQFAKRQDSWFRKLERDGFPIYWIRPEELDSAIRTTRVFLDGYPLPPPSFKLSETFYGPKQSPVK